MGIRFEEIIGSGEDEKVKVWWMLATAALYELGREFTPDMGVMNAIVNGDIQLHQRTSRTKDGMPSFKAVMKGDDYLSRKSSGVTNGH